ncbi:hypothetical protein C3492_11110 [Streptomyces sp. Ru62]|uniref:hypothetical protein n=1 Tax=Streptomyces sp. Ru62 TaxID=2080745 RepID=UPI000CDD20A8|nr:hypothetical protein [Streptomyces sp. Ru62]POX63671.1 hypothetical protein C3492_11110 [Streptomyces sp. Ru62]
MDVVPPAPASVTRAFTVDFVDARPGPHRLRLPGLHRLRLPGPHRPHLTLKDSDGSVLSREAYWLHRTTAATRDPCGTSAPDREPARPRRVPGASVTPSA